MIQLTLYLWLNKRFCLFCLIYSIILILLCCYRQHFHPRLRPFSDVLSAAAVSFRITLYYFVCFNKDRIFLDSSDCFRIFSSFLSNKCFNSSSLKTKLRCSIFCSNDKMLSSFVKSSPKIKKP